MDQNRDGFIDKNDLRDTFAALGTRLVRNSCLTCSLQHWFRVRVHLLLLCTPGRLNVGNDELDEMLKEAPGPINFTIFLSMFGEKLKGTKSNQWILSTLQFSALWWAGQTKFFMIVLFMKERILRRTSCPLLRYSTQRGRESSKERSEYWNQMMVLMREL